MPKKPDYAALYTLRADGRYMGYYRGPDGKRRALYDVDPARLHEKIREKEREMEDKPLTFAEIAEAWKDVRFEELSYKSVEAYKAPYRRLVERFGRQRIEEIETRDVNAYLDRLAIRGHAKRMVQLHRDMMSQIYNAAIARGQTRYNPCDHAAMPRGLTAGSRGVVSPEAVEAIKRGAEQPFGLFALLCLYTGLRRGEALALRYEDIDREAKEIHVRRSVVFQGNTPQIKATKTKNGVRDVVLPDILAGKIGKGSGYIFSDEGKLLTRDQYRKRWAAYCKAIGFEITAHQLRHGYASMLYEADVGDKDAQEQLGHANITLTRDVYTHISKKQRSRTAAKINKFIERESTQGDDIEKTVQDILALLDGKNVGEILSRLMMELGKYVK